MRKAHAIAVAAMAAALSGAAAAAASGEPKEMTVPLANGSVVHIEYEGEAAPEVTIAPAADRLCTGFEVPFGDLGRIMEEMQRRMGAMMRRIDQIPARPPLAGGAHLVSYGDMPAGSRSVSIVTTSNGGKSCTRRTEIVSQGAGEPPKMVSTSSGDCAAMKAIPAPATPEPPAPPETAV